MQENQAITHQQHQRHVTNKTIIIFIHHSKRPHHQPIH